MLISELGCVWNEKVCYFAAVVVPVLVAVHSTAVKASVSEVC